LTGRGWLNELIVGHPDYIKFQLGIRVHVFLALVAQIQVLGGLPDSQHVHAVEQVTIFLYTCVTELSIHHVGERFQHFDGKKKHIQSLKGHTTSLAVTENGSSHRYI
jgi:hypothetical protein